MTPGKDHDRHDRDMALQTPADHAAFWMSLRRSGEMTAHDEREFQVWLGRDPAHAAAYADMERHWRVLGAVSDDAEVMAIYESATKRDERAVILRRGMGIAACLALAAIAGWGVSRTGLVDRLIAGAEAPAQRYVTAVGERRIVNLEDGSLATLDTDSVLTTQGWGRKRQVVLERGRAFFQVVRDTHRPFVVVARGRTVTAVGTAFDVSVEPASVEVVLAQGRVRIDEPKTKDREERSVEMRQGWRLTARDGARWKMEQVDIAKETSWLAGRLDFNEDTLGQAVAQMNRYSAKKIVLRDAALAERPIIGVFAAGDIDSFVKALRIYGIARVAEQTETSVELRTP